MPRVEFLLGFIVLLWTSPWISGEPSVDVNGTNKSPAYIDDTRRENKEDLNVPQLSETFKSSFRNDSEKENQTKPIATARMLSPEYPLEEITDFNTEVSCDNAQFLLKILTVMLPLLRNEVPESTRTSYILLILKDLLKTSPEAAKDYDIMSKINDLILALDKYHNSDVDIEPDAVLRKLSSPPGLPSGVKSKVVFKYEIPQLANPKCTAELLKIVKVVQEAILKLVNNPLCRSSEPLELPFFVNFEENFDNPNLYSYLPQKNRYDVKDTYPANNEINKIDQIPLYSGHDNRKDIEEIIIQNDQNAIHSFYPNAPHLGHTSIKDNSYSPYDDSLSHKKYPALPEDSNINPYNIHPEYSNALYPNPDHTSFEDNPYSSYDASPSNEMYPSLPLDPNMENYNVYHEYPNNKNPNYPNGPSYYPTKNEPQYIPLRPKHNIIELQRPDSLLDVDNFYQTSTSSNLGYNPAVDYDIKPNEAIDVVPNNYFDIAPKNRPQIKWPYQEPEQSSEVNINSYPDMKMWPSKDRYEIDKYNVKYPHPSFLPHDLKKEMFEDDYDEFIPDDPKRPELDITGSPETAYIPLGPEVPENDDIYYIRPGQNPKKPNRYDSSPEARPIINGVRDPLFNAPNYIPNKPNIHNSYWPLDYEDIPYKPLKPIGVPETELKDFEFDPSLDSVTPIKLNIQQSPKGSKYPYNDLPYYWPENGNIDGNGKLIPDFHPSIVPEPIENQPWIPDIENPYKPYENYSPYKDIYSPGQEPYNSDHPEVNINKQPDKNILFIVKDNIDVIEHKIPKEYMNPEILGMIRRLKDLLDLEQITVKEYVNIINQYQILIEYVKHMKIGNAIMKDLQLSMTNLDKLDLQTGKSKLIELTYLIKRPKPLVYQPYYYIKYRLPYTSFLTRIERLLAQNPQLTKYPAKLYKALIPISQVFETSPDLQGYGEEDILRLTFNDGTLAGAKIIKGKDLDMYNTLDQLKHINSDLSVDDAYQLIKNLQSKLKPTEDGLILKNTDIPALNIQGVPDAIHIKVHNKPILEKITKITTNKVAADKIITNLLSNVNYLRSNASDDIVAKSSDSLNIDSDKQLVNDNSVIGRSRDEYDLLLNDPLYAPKSVDKYYTRNEYQLPADHNNGFKKLYPALKISESDLNWNPYLNPSKYTDTVFSTKQTKSFDLNPYEQQSNNYNSKSYDFEAPVLKPNQGYSYLGADSNTADSDLDLTAQNQLNPILDAKLIEATLKATKNYDQENLNSHKYYLESPLTPISTSKIISSPKTVNSRIIKHSRTYINGIPVKHSKTYLTKKDDNLENFETSNIVSTNFNMPGDTKVYSNDDSFIENYNPLGSASEFSNTNLGSQYETYNIDDANNLVQDQGYLSDNSYTDKYNTGVAGLSFGQTKAFNGRQTYISESSYMDDNKNNLASNLGNNGRNIIANNLMGSRYRYIMHQRPFIHPLGRNPSLIRYPLLG